MTVSQKGLSKKIKANPNLTVIGHMTESNQGMHLITRGQEKIGLRAQGWNPLVINRPFMVSTGE